jgi:hypothetical protein
VISLFRWSDNRGLIRRASGTFLAAAIPGATVIETTGGGHVTADPTQDIVQTHEWLATGRLPGE